MKLKLKFYNKFGPETEYDHETINSIEDFKKNWSLVEKDGRYFEFYMYSESFSLDDWVCIFKEIQPNAHVKFLDVSFLSGRNLNFHWGPKCECGLDKSMAEGKHSDYCPKWRKDA